MEQMKKKGMRATADAVGGKGMRGRRRAAATVRRA